MIWLLFWTWSDSRVISDKSLIWKILRYDFPVKILFSSFLRQSGNISCFNFTKDVAAGFPGTAVRVFFFIGLIVYFSFGISVQSFGLNELYSIYIYWEILSSNKSIYIQLTFIPDFIPFWFPMISNTYRLRTFVKVFRLPKQRLPTIFYCIIFCINFLFFDPNIITVDLLNHSSTMMWRNLYI